MFEPTVKGYKMRKLKLLIVLALVFALAVACAQTTGTTATSSISPVLDRIVQRGELVVGTAGSMPPLNMTTKDGRVIGIEPDLARFMASSMGVKLRIETMHFHELLPALEAGKVDMVLSGMTITGRRNLTAAFVGPYFISGKSVLTKLKTLAGVRSPSDINSPNTRLVALKDSTSQLFVENVIPKAKLLTADNYDQAVGMLIKGQAHALIADYPICAVSVFRYPDQQFTTLVEPFTYEPIGIVLPADDPLLMNWAQNFLVSMNGSGQLDKLRDRWIKNTSWLKELPEVK
jgi:polar amino acid transport system substrate-binding protein